ncbi:hydroxyacylglutathione hydrolase [Glaesserella sp.]|uniref:hydroxyacylglutathione hydrolase n=1 Tax=Glaesserella sp. TaxID=2094731 RepID=UPI0035A071B0
MAMITPIPALSDNYIWILQKGTQAVIVDPAEAKSVMAFFAKNTLKPTAILLTHNHKDHTDGVAEIVSHYPNIMVYGPSEVSQFTDKIVQDGDIFTLLDLPILVIKSAGHTAEHISYLVDNRDLFCGDALFSGGCGRVFTGDYQAQFEALQRFKQLNDTVNVYPAHEYTLNNLKFAQTIMPANCELIEYQERADILRAQNRPTLPTTIGIEKKINPFMRAENLATFIELRKKKDNF